MYRNETVDFLKCPKLNIGGNDMTHEWLERAKKLQAIAQTGLAYSKDKYDLERFEMLQEMSIEMLSEFTEMDQIEVTHLFDNETGYPTPKTDIRAVIFKDDKILMVQENDGEWSLPGGWADIGFSPSEIAVKETKEESGFDVKTVKLIALFDKKCHPHPPSAFHVYKIFIQCEIIGGAAQTGIETKDVEFFSASDLPTLSVERNTKSQIEIAFRHLYNPEEPMYFD